MNRPLARRLAQLEQDLIRQLAAETPAAEWVQEMPDHPDEWTLLVDEDSVDEDAPVLWFYASAWESGEWEVGECGPMGGPIERGQTETLAEAKLMAEGVWRAVIAQ